MSDYKQTIFLPKTSFPMKGDLAKREPDFVKRWKELGLYQKIRQKSKGKEKFVLHAGPPYANGHFHIGHAFTGIFKDIVVRTQQMLGKDAPFVPGWDCHGLPIEWKIEEGYQKKKLRKEDVPILQFRSECRAFAQHWIDVQKEETRRMGILADLEHPYVTMDYASEAAITAELFKFLENGGLEKGFKPVMWSVVEKTALAEAEIEYQDRKSPSIYVRFPIIETNVEATEGASVVIWTTTPWTLPGNRAVAYGKDIIYSVLEVTEVKENSFAKKGEKFLLAKELVEPFAKTVGIDYKILKDEMAGDQLKGMVCAHPLKDKGYDFFKVPLLEGEHVTTDTGTGFVHTAPGHGLEDFEIGKIFGLEIPETVAEDGTYYDHVPLFKGDHVFKVNPKVIEALIETGALVNQSEITHSYPHSWRSKAPLIFRTTPQWFVSLEKNDLRKKALKAIDQVSWFPSQSANRIRAMVEQSPDWCISRQRAWGVPIALFLDKKTGKPLQNESVNKTILSIFEQEGCDAWFKEGSAERFLKPVGLNTDDFDQVKDILDVWFESGSSQGFVLEKRSELGFPASLYLEGSDQHRGWFQKSLIIGCGTRDQAPFKAVVTHGFVVDEHGKKMSKSLGNVVSPGEVSNTLGAEILRLWVIGADYTDDLRIGPEVLKYQQEVYRRFRNTLRYLLGALSEYNDQEKVEYKDFPLLERWVLHRLAELFKQLKTSSQDYTYQAFYSQLHTFCAVDLSAFYFDIRKDSLYCDSQQSSHRKATRTVMKILFDCLAHWLAPVLCFTAEEAWLSLSENSDESIHLRLFPEVQEAWFDPSLGSFMEKLRLQRKVMTGALEEARAKGVIGASLQAFVQVYDPQKKLSQDIDLTEFCIVSKLEISADPVPHDAYKLSDVEGLGAKVFASQGNKCERCWKVLEEVGTNPVHPSLCKRCSDVVETFKDVSCSNRQRS
jgi:isoleucyl-tRNA synthetase